MDAKRLPFRLIKGGLDANSPPLDAGKKWHIQPINSVNQALLAVLRAQLTSTATVERATSFHLKNSMMEEQHILEDMFRDAGALFDAGLQRAYSPDGIILRNPDAFAAKFPELINTIPFMLAHDGVQVGTLGQPRYSEPFDLNQKGQVARTKRNRELLASRKGNPESMQRKFSSTKQALYAVLKAKLKPARSVEEAYDFIFSDAQIGIVEWREAVDELRNAGLEIVLDETKAHIALTNPENFVRRFPELEAAVPVMLAHQGVKVHTYGEPYRSTPIEYEKKRGKWKQKC